MGSSKLEKAIKVWAVCFCCYLLFLDIYLGALMEWLVGLAVPPLLAIHGFQQYIQKMVNIIFL